MMMMVVVSAAAMDREEERLEGCRGRRRVWRKIRR